MLTRPTLTIGIPAYNESANIGYLINSVIRQKHRNFTLKKIVVYSDGSSDNTNQIVRNLNNKYQTVELKEFHDRRGKIFRLNEIFSDNHSEILIILDADIKLADNNVLDNLVFALIQNSKVNMVTADPQPVCPKNLTGKLLYSTFVLWDYIRLSVPNQDHVQNFYGPATAYRRSFAQSLHIPDGLEEERVYLYLMAKKTDSFRYCRKAVIYYWALGTISDFIKLSNRSFSKKQSKLDEIFGFDTAQITIIPFKYKLAGIWKSFINQPVLTPVAILFNLFLRVLTYFIPVQKREFWDISISTKKDFSHV